MKLSYEALKTQLKDDYRDTFTTAYDYCVSLNPDSDYCDDKMTELYDLLFTAQTEGKAVEKVTGNSKELFIKNYFSDFGVNERLKSIFKLPYGFFIFCLIDEIFNIFYNIQEKSLMSIESHIFKFIVLYIPGIIVLSIIINFISSKKALKTSRKNELKWSLTVIGISMICLAAVFSVIEILGSLKITSPTADLKISSVFSAGISIMYILFYNAVIMISRYKKYGTIKKYSTQISGNSYYKNIRNRDISKSQLNAYKQQYAKLLKNNKTTEETFINEIRKSSKRTHTADIILMIIIPVMFYSGTVIGIITADDITNIITNFIFSSIFCIPFMLFFHNINKSNYRFSISLAERCETSGMTMPSFIDSELEKFTK